MPETYLFLFDIVAIATSSQPHIYCLPQFCSDSACFWSANGDATGVVLLLPRLVPIYYKLVPILLNDNTYRCVCVGKCVIHLDK